MREIIRIRRLKKDGSADRKLYLPVIDALRSGSAVIMPVDGVYGVAAVPSGDERRCAELHPSTELLVTELSVLEPKILISKREYDFLKRVWPDEVTVTIAPSDGIDPVHARIPANPVNRDIIAGAGGLVFFAVLTGKNGKAISKKSELLGCAERCSAHAMFIDEWCKSHPLPTVVDIRGGGLSHVRKGKVSIEEIQSLYFLGQTED